MNSINFSIFGGMYSEPFSGVLKNSCSENLEKIFKKLYFSKVAGRNSILVIFQGFCPRFKQFPNFQLFVKFPEQLSVATL